MKIILALGALTFSLSTCGTHSHEHRHAGGIVHSHPHSHVHPHDGLLEHEHPDVGEAEARAKPSLASLADHDHFVSP